MDRAAILAMKLPDLGLGILRQLATGSGTPNPNNFVRGYFASLPPASPFPGGVIVTGGQSPNQDRELAEALLEGWQWLVSEGLIAPDPLEKGSWHFITRRGRTLLGQT